MLQPNGIRFHCHDPLDRKTFGWHGMSIEELKWRQIIKKCITHM
jgi:hypothetical protein